MKSNASRLLRKPMPSDYGEKEKTISLLHSPPEQQTINFVVVNGAITETL